MPHVFQPGIFFGGTNAKRHVPSAHSWMAPVATVGLMSACALNEKEREMLFRFRQILRIERAQQLVGFHAAVERLYQPEIRFIVLDLLVYFCDRIVLLNHLLSRRLVLCLETLRFCDGCSRHLSS